MNAPTQLHLICRLESLREEITKTTGKEIMIAIARQAYVLASPVSIDPSFGYKIEGKERILTILAHEIRSYEKSNSETEVIRFQLASTILMLMLQFMQGSLGDLQEVIKENRKVA